MKANGKLWLLLALHRECGTSGGKLLLCPLDARSVRSAGVILLPPPKRRGRMLMCCGTWRACAWNGSLGACMTVQRVRVRLPEHLGVRPESLLSREDRRKVDLLRVWPQVCKSRHVSFFFSCARAKGNLQVSMLWRVYFSRFLKIKNV